MLLWLAAALIATATGAWVLSPLASRSRRLTAARIGGDLESLLDEKERAYDALDELRADLDLGKLSETEYERLHGRYRLQAVAALKAVSEREAELGLERRPAPPAFAVTRAGRTPNPRAASRRRALMYASITASAVFVFAAVVLSVYLNGSRAQGGARAVATLPGEGFAGLALDPQEGRAAVAGDDAGVLRSEDGGRTWSRVGSIGGRTTAVTRGAEGAILAIIDGDLRRSLDGGASWQRAGDVKLSAVAGDPATPGVVYGTNVQGRLVSSRDSGETWQDVQSRAAGGIHSLTVASSDQLRLFGADDTGVVMWQGGVWGRASGVVNGALPTQMVHAVVFDAGSGDSVELPGGERASDALYAATDVGVFKSTDRGSSWVRLGLSEDVRAIAVGPAGTGIVTAVAADGRVYRSSNRGVTWNG